LLKIIGSGFEITLTDKHKVKQVINILGNYKSPIIAQVDEHIKRQYRRKFVRKEWTQIDNDIVVARCDQAKVNKIPLNRVYKTLAKELGRSMASVGMRYQRVLDSRE
jgi:hypothetical protein